MLTVIIRDGEMLLQHNDHPEVIRIALPGITIQDGQPWASGDAHVTINDDMNTIVMNVPTEED